MKQSTSNKTHWIISSVIFFLFQSNGFADDSKLAEPDIPSVRVFLSQVYQDGIEDEGNTTRLLVINKPEKGQKPSTISYQEMETSSQCQENPDCLMSTLSVRVRQFKITRIIREECNVIRTIGLEIVHPNQQESTPNPSRIDIYDKTKSHCFHNPENLWEIRLADNLELHQSKRYYQYRYFLGAPELIWDYKSCLKQVAKSSCPDKLSPIQCTANSVDQREQDILPLTAMGNNYCHATQQIKAQACRLGFKPERFQVSDFSCQKAGNRPNSGVSLTMKANMGFSHK